MYEGPKYVSECNFEWKKYIFNQLYSLHAEWDVTCHFSIIANEIVNLEIKMIACYKHLQNLIILIYKIKGNLEV